MAEDELEAPPALVNHTSKMYLSEEAWEEKWKLQEGFGGDGSSSRGGGASGRDANRGKDHGGGNGRNDHDSSGSSPSGPSTVGRNQCRKCGKKGHWARNCRSKPEKEAAYLA
jgi:hypothetical protein